MVGFHPLGGAPLGSSGTVKLVYSLPAEGGQFALQASAAAFRYEHGVIVDAGGFVLHPGAATLSFEHALAANTGGLVLQPAATQFVAEWRLAAGSGGLALAAGSTQFAHHGDLSARAGHLALEPVAAKFASHRRLPADGAALALIPGAATLRLNQVLLAAGGSIALQPAAAGFRFDHAVQASTAALALQPGGATLRYQHALVAGPGSLAMHPGDGRFVVRGQLPATAGTFALAAGSVSFKSGEAPPVIIGTVPDDYGCLVKISPLDPETGDRVDIYASSFGHRREAKINGYDGHVWEPCITQRPRLGMSLWNGDFTDGIAPGSATLPLNLGILAETYPGVETFNWAGAPIEISVGRVTDLWPWGTAFRGKVSSYGGSFPALTLQASVDTEPFERNVLSLTYAGTGGLEGGSDLKNQLKPLIFGWASNVEPLLIDEVDSVYQFSAYGPIEAVSTLYERGSDFGAKVGDFANYTALVAAEIPPGRWATCLGQGLIRLGAPAAGVITGDVRGHVVVSATPRLTGQVIAALAAMCEVPPDYIDADTLAALDAAVPFPVNVVITEQDSFLAWARRLALPCNWQAGVSLNRMLFVTRPHFAAAEAITLHAQGRALPQVIASEEIDVSPPYAKTTLGAARSWRVHSAEEIAFDFEVVPTGRYSDTKTYRGGMTVNLIDGSEWVYINETPSAGNPPPTWPVTSNAWWENMTPPSDIVSSQVAIRTAAIRRPRDQFNASRFLLLATTSGAGVSNISVARHDWDYPNGSDDVTRVIGAISGLTPETDYYVYFDDPTLADTNPAYAVATTPDAGENNSDNPYRHPLGKIRTPAIGEGETRGGALPGYGYATLQAADEAATNFNARNDQNGAPLIVPIVSTTGTAIDHTLGANASADISFEWSWFGNEFDIDGFEVMTYASSSSAAYTPDSSPAAQRIDIVGPDRRALILFGVDPTKHHTFAVRAYRIVDPNIDADQRMYSAWVKSTAAGENPYQPSANVAFDGDITGTIDGVDASLVATAIGNFNSRNDRDGSAIAAPVVAVDGSAVDHTINEDASTDLSFEWTWGGSNNDIDGWEVVVVQRVSSVPYTIGATPSIEMLYRLPPDRRALIHPGQNPTSWYTFYVRAFRVVDQDVAASGIISSPWAKATGAGENPYQPSSSVAFGGNITGTINGLAASTVSLAVQNFNARNDRNGAPIVVPTVATNGTAVDHIVQPTGSVNISFEWAWTGNNDDIDGWEVLLYASVSSSVYTPGANPAAEALAVMPADRRAVTIQGVHATYYYTFAVRAFREVDEDIAPGGKIYTAWIKPSLSTENPYRPESNVAFTGNLTGTINGTPASTVASWSSYAYLGLNSDGSVKPDKVTTRSIRDQALIAAGYTEMGGSLGVGRGNNVASGGAQLWPMVNSLNIQGARVVVDFVFPWWADMYAPIQNQIFYFNVCVYCRDLSSGVVRYGSEKRGEYQWQGPSTTSIEEGATQSMTMQGVFDNLTINRNYQFGWRIQTYYQPGFGRSDGGADIIMYQFKYMKVNDLRATE